LRFELVNPPEGTPQDKLYSLQEYTDLIKNSQEQKQIYYINSSSRKSAQLSPYMDGLREVPVLLLTDDIDDFVVNSIGPFGERMFVSVDSGEVEMRKSDTTNDSSSVKLSEEEKTQIISLFKEAIGEKKISEIVFSSNLVSSPAIVTSQLSPHMRKMMKSIIAQSSQGNVPKDEDMFDAMPVKLQLSESDEMIRSLVRLTDDGGELKKLIPNQIYYNAMISAGMIDDARVVVPIINDLVKVCINQAIAKRAAQA